ncbi:MAG: alpha/beta hydrolase [Eubacteriales bacterium]|nr:alpha/beta hydrolase [Eubacteriales bacterium]
MEIREYGAQNEQKVLLLPGSISHYSWYLPLVDLLQESWHVYLVLYDGYTEPYDSPFISTEDSCNKILDYCHQEGIEKFELVYGLSMGGAIASLIYLADQLSIDNLIIDGTAEIEKSTPFLTKLNIWRCLLGIKLVRKSKTIMKLAFPKERWLWPGENEAEHYAEVFDFINQLSLETIDNSIITSLNLKLPDELPKNETRLFHIYGSREDRTNDWTKLYPSIKVREIPDCEHGELCIMKPHELVDLIEDLIKSDS